MNLTDLQKAIYVNHKSSGNTDHVIHRVEHYAADFVVVHYSEVLHHSNLLNIGVKDHTLKTTEYLIHYDGTVSLLNKEGNQIACINPHIEVFLEDEALDLLYKSVCDGRPISDDLRTSIYLSANDKVLKEGRGVLILPEKDKRKPYLQPYFNQVSKTEESTKAEEHACLSSEQIGGNHYKEMGITPWEVICADKNTERVIGFFNYTAIAYLMRAGYKGSAIEDVDKAIHTLQQLSKELKRRNYHGNT